MATEFLSTQSRVRNAASLRLFLAVLMFLTEQLYGREGLTDVTEGRCLLMLVRRGKKSF